jgi:CBS domain-containing protein
MHAAATVVGNVSVQTASDQMTSRGVGSSTVVDQGGRLTGTVSQKAMRRDVGGRGHDPETVSVETQVESGSASCFEDETVDHAEDTMRQARVDELSILNREGVLVGTTTRAAIAQNKVGQDLPVTASEQRGFSRVGNEHALDTTL